MFASNLVAVTSLQPGSYILKVQAANRRIGSEPREPAFSDDSNEGRLRLSRILSGIVPIGGKGNNRNGNHRLQTELQESGDSADNQNTGTTLR